MRQMPQETGTELRTSRWWVQEVFSYLRQVQYKQGNTKSALTDDSDGILEINTLSGRRSRQHRKVQNERETLSRPSPSGLPTYSLEKTGGHRPDCQLLSL